MSADDQQAAEHERWIRQQVKVSQHDPSMGERAMGWAVGEIDRLRAELAETRAELHGGTGAAAVLRERGDALADAKNWVGHVVEAERWRSVRGDAPAPAEPPADAAMLPRLAPHLPHRGSDVATWLRAHRERHALMTEAWATIDDLLDDYRLHADTGTPLTEASGTGVPEETCGCGTTTATEKPPAVELPVTLSSVDDVAASKARGLGRVQAMLDRLRPHLPGDLFGELSAAVYISDRPITAEDERRAIEAARGGSR